MHKYSVVAIIFLLYLGIVPADVRAEEVLSWDECVAEARQNHPDLAAAFAQLRQTEIDKAITRSALLPQISGSISGKTAESNNVTSDTYAYSVSGEQLLFDSFKTAKDLGSDTQTIAAQKYDYIVSSSNIRLDLRTAFVGLLKAQDLLLLTEEISKRREQNLDLVRLRYEAGREHKGALLTAQADLAQAKFETTQAQRNLTLSQRQLIKELGRQKFSPLKVKGDFEVVNTERQRPDFEAIADNTPFLKELVAKKEVARFDLESSKADFFPTVYLNSSAGRTDSDWPPSNDTWSAGVSVSFPIFEGSSRISKLSKSRALLDQREAEERSGRDSVILTLEETWTDLQNALDEVLVKEKYLAAVAERAKIAGSQYSSGLISFDDWVIIEDNLINAKKAFLNSRANALLDEATWIQAKGGALNYEN